MKRTTTFGAKLNTEPYPVHIAILKVAFDIRVGFLLQTHGLEKDAFTFELPQGEIILVYRSDDEVERKKFAFALHKIMDEYDKMLADYEAFFIQLFCEMFALPPEQKTWRLKQISAYLDQQGVSS